MTVQHPIQATAAEPRPIPPAQDAPPVRPGTLGRLATFRTTYLAVFLFAVAYVFTVEGLEHVLGSHFRERVAAAARVAPGRGPVAQRVQENVRAALHDSPWVRFGEVHVRAIVLGADGRTLLFAGGTSLPVRTDPGREASELLPAIVDVSVAVPHNTLLANGVLVGYAAILLSVLYGIARRVEQQEIQRLREVSTARDALLERTRHIEGELEQVQRRLGEVEPEKEIYAEEIHELEQERGRLLARLAEVEQREEALRSQSSAARDLEEERRSLEELLEEAARELAERDAEIRRLERQARQPARRARGGREEEQLGRRLRTLYKNLEIDDAALAALARLGDEGLKLRAEEALKRLSDDPETAGVRRKVGGLPPHLAIFELGFGGRGRIYTTKGETRRFRVLLVGTKATQKTDLEYLSRLPKAG